MNLRNALHSSFCLMLVLPPHRCLIKDFELRLNVQDLLQHVFIKQTVGREKILQKQLIELIDLNQQIGVIEKTRYCVLMAFVSMFLSRYLAVWAKYSRTVKCLIDFDTKPMKNLKHNALPVSGCYMLGCCLAFADSIIQITLLAGCFTSPVTLTQKTGQSCTGCTWAVGSLAWVKMLPFKVSFSLYSDNMSIPFLSFKPSWKDRQKLRQ